MLLLILAPTTFAQSTLPIRRTRLQDGREFVGEVLGTEATGLRVRVPPGEMLVSFEDLIEVKPIDATAYASQKPWRVILTGPEALVPVARTMIDAMPGVTARPIGMPDDGLSPAQTDALVDCAGEISCMRTVLKDQPWQWIIVMTQPEGQPLTLTSVVSSGDRAMPDTHSVATLDAPSLWGALHQALQLELPKSPPPEVPGFGGRSKPPKGTRTPSELGPNASFVPIPGWTGFKSGEAGKGAAALLGAAAFTGASVFGGAALVAGKEESGSGALQMGVFGVAGFLTSTWALNELIAPKGGTALLPTPDGARIAGSF